MLHETGVKKLHHIFCHTSNLKSTYFEKQYGERENRDIASIVRDMTFYSQSADKLNL